MENVEQEKTLKCHVELNFNNFQERKIKKIQVDCYDIFFIGIDIIKFFGIDIIRFEVKIISELVFTIILYLFLLHIHLEGEY